MSEPGEFLTGLGYVRVPLTRSGVGHFHTAGTLNGRPVELLVDSANGSVRSNHQAVPVPALRYSDFLGRRSRRSLGRDLEPRLRLADDRRRDPGVAAGANRGRAGHWTGGLPPNHLESL